jgi:pyridoxal phosphate enzyme (YggS family)
MSVSENLLKFKSQLPDHVTLIAVSKTHPAAAVQEAYNSGHLDFGENRVQELVPKHDELPKDIRWHLIGHLQTNKVKYIAPFVHMIHSVDSEKLLTEISKQAVKCNRVIPVLLQIFIAQEETKFGFSEEEVRSTIDKYDSGSFPGVEIRGFMGMATNTDNHDQVRGEFRRLRGLFTEISTAVPSMKTLSMGMSSDWKIAIEEGSNMIRIGTAIFGHR